MSELKIKHTKVFTKNIKAFQNADVRFIVNKGGSRSSKTYSILQLLVWYALSNNHKTISVVRKTMPALRASAYRDFQSILSELNLWDGVEHNKTESKFTFKDSNTIIQFFSTDDAAKLRGRKHDVVYINEANELNEDDFLQLNLRTKSKIILDYNPSDLIKWIEDLKKTPENMVEIHSTYKDNSFLPTAQVREIESLINKDEVNYQIYALGIHAEKKERVFTRKEWGDFPSEVDFVYGMDFGSVDPTTVVKVYINDGVVYMDEMFFESNLNPKQMLEKMNDVQISKQHIIYPDVSRPDLIDYLSVEGGYQFAKSDKTIKAGYDFLRNHKFIVAPGSENIWKELSRHNYKVIRGEITSTPVDLFNHCFVGETNVETDNGLMEIKDITPGTKVLTSQGYKHVVKLWENGEKEVFEYVLQLDILCIFIKCTKDHKIKTNKGWISISKLEPQMKVYLSKNFLEKNINSTKVKSILVEAPEDFTELFGSTLKDPYQKTTISTTKTKTLQTTSSQTLTAYLQSCTLNQKVSSEQKTILNLSKGLLQKEMKKQSNGTGQLKEDCGIQSTQRIITSVTLPTEVNLVKHAKKNLKQRKKSKSFVPTNASQKTEEIKGLIKKTDSVTIVESYLQLTNTQNQKTAVEAVLQKVDGKKVGKHTVYDIEVHGVHEYFANGLLVHNSIDSIRYAAYTHWGKILNYDDDVFTFDY